jgi:hypothetical protein
MNATTCTLECTATIPTLFLSVPSPTAVVSGSLCAEACRPAAPRPDARKNAPPAMAYDPAPAWVARAPVRNQLSNWAIRAPVANRRLRGRERLRCILRTDAARWPNRATVRHAPAQIDPLTRSLANAYERRARSRRAEVGGRRPAFARTRFQASYCEARRSLGVSGRSQGRRCPGGNGDIRQT